MRRENYGWTLGLVTLSHSSYREDQPKNLLPSVSVLSPFSSYTRYPTKICLTSVPSSVSEMATSKTVELYQTLEVSQTSMISPFFIFILHS